MNTLKWIAECGKSNFKISKNPFLYYSAKSNQKFQSIFFSSRRFFCPDFEQNKKKITPTALFTCWRRRKEWVKVVKANLKRKQFRRCEKKLCRRRRRRRRQLRCRRRYVVMLVAQFTFRFDRYSWLRAYGCDSANSLKNVTAVQTKQSLLEWKHL